MPTSIQQVSPEITPEIVAEHGITISIRTVVDGNQFDVWWQGGITRLQRSPQQVTLIVGGNDDGKADVRGQIRWE